MTLTRQQVEERALEAATVAFESALPLDLNRVGVRAANRAAIAAHQQALWQPLGDGTTLPADDHAQLLCWLPEGPHHLITTAHSIREALALHSHHRPLWVGLVERWRFWTPQKLCQPRKIPLDRTRRHDG